MRATIIALLLGTVALEGSVVAATQDAAAARTAVDQALERAAAAVEAGRRPEAKKLLASAADRYDSVRALMQLARIQSGEGDAAGALVTLERARRLAPDAEDVLSAIAQVALAGRTPVPAILALEPLTRLAPRTAQHHYLLGVALMQAGDMPAAVEVLREADRLRPGQSLTAIALGIALNSRKLFDEAGPLLREVLEREPDNVEALAALAEAEEGLGELEAADTHAKRALAASPQHPTANLVIGMVLMKHDRYQEAKPALERAIAADRDSPKAYYQLSLACARLGDVDGAAANRQLYQQKLRAMEARIEELRRAGMPGPDATR
jgi:predicted Zn-dependent protease